MRSEAEELAVAKALLRLASALALPLRAPIPRDAASRPIRIMGIDAFVGLGESIAWPSDLSGVANEDGTAFLSSGAARPCGLVPQLNPENALLNIQQVIQESVESPVDGLPDFSGLPWLGLSCRGNRLVAIRLPSLGLRGRLSDISHSDWQTIMMDLELLDLSENSLFGDLSSFFIGSELSTLLLGGNLLSGQLPIDLSSGKLTTVSLGRYPIPMNPGLSGEISGSRNVQPLVFDELASRQRLAAMAQSPLQFIAAGYRSTGMFLLPRHLTVARGLASASVPCLDPADVVAAQDSLCQAARSCSVCLNVRFLGASLGSTSPSTDGSSSNPFSGLGVAASNELGQHLAAKFRRPCSPMITRARHAEGEFVGCLPQSDREHYESLRSSLSFSQEVIDIDEGLFGDDGIPDLEPTTDDGGNVLISCDSLWANGLVDDSSETDEDGSASSVVDERGSVRLGNIVEVDYDAPKIERCESLNATRARVPYSASCSDLSCIDCISAQDCMVCSDARGFIGCLPIELSPTERQERLQGVSNQLIRMLGGEGTLLSNQCSDLACAPPMTAIVESYLSPEQALSICPVSDEETSNLIDMVDFCAGATSVEHCCSLNTREGWNEAEYGTHHLGLPDGSSCQPCLASPAERLGNQVETRPNTPRSFIGCVPSVVGGRKLAQDPIAIQESCFEAFGTPRLPDGIQPTHPEAELVMMHESEESICSRSGLTAEIAWFEHVFGPITAASETRKKRQEEEKCSPGNPLFPGCCNYQDCTGYCNPSIDEFPNCCDYSTDGDCDALYNCPTSPLFPGCCEYADCTGACIPGFEYFPSCCAYSQCPETSTSCQPGGVRFPECCVVEGCPGHCNSSIDQYPQCCEFSDELTDPQCAYDTLDSSYTVLCEAGSSDFPACCQHHPCPHQCMPGFEYYPQCCAILGPFGCHDMEDTTPCTPAHPEWPECGGDVDVDDDNSCSPASDNWPSCFLDSEAAFNIIQQKQSVRCHEGATPLNCVACSLEPECLVCSGEAGEAICQSRTFQCPNEIFPVSSCGSACALISPESSVDQGNQYFIATSSLDALSLVMPEWAEIDSCSVCMLSSVPSISTAFIWEDCVPCLTEEGAFVTCAGSVTAGCASGLSQSAVYAVEEPDQRVICPLADPFVEDWCNLIPCPSCGRDFDSLPSWSRRCQPCAGDDGLYTSCLDPSMSNSCGNVLSSMSPSSCDSRDSSGCGGFSRTCSECLSTTSPFGRCRPCTRFSNRSLEATHLSELELDFSTWGDTYCMTPLGSEIECAEWADSCDGVGTPGCSSLGAGSCETCQSLDPFLQCAACKSLAGDPICTFSNHECSGTLVQPLSESEIQECQGVYVSQECYSRDEYGDCCYGEAPCEDLHCRLCGSPDSNLDSSYNSACDSSDAGGDCCHQEGTCMGGCRPCMYGYSAMCVIDGGESCCMATNEFGVCDGPCPPCHTDDPHQSCPACSQCTTISSDPSAQCCPGDCSVDDLQFCPPCSAGPYNLTTFVSRCNAMRSDNGFTDIDCVAHGCSVCLHSSSGEFAHCGLLHGQGCHSEGLMHSPSYATGVASCNQLEGASICNVCSQANNCLACHVGGRFRGCAENCTTVFGSEAYDTACEIPSSPFELYFDTTGSHEQYSSIGTCEECLSMPSADCVPCQLAPGWPFFRAASSLLGGCEDLKLTTMNGCGGSSILGIKDPRYSTALDAYCGQFSPDFVADAVTVSTLCGACVTREKPINGPVPHCQFCQTGSNFTCESTCPQGSEMRTCPSGVSMVRKRQLAGGEAAASLMDAREELKKLRRRRIVGRRPGNRFSGPLPRAWIEENHFVFLDLSFNDFTGTAPSIRLGDSFFSDWMQWARNSTSFDYAGDQEQTHRALLESLDNWQREWELPSAAFILRSNRFEKLPTTIDISRLSYPSPGDLDAEFDPATSVQGQAVTTGGFLLDFSCNQFNTSVPEEFVDLTKIDSIDMSANSFFGRLTFLKLYPFANNETISNQCSRVASGEAYGGGATDSKKSRQVCEAESLKRVERARDTGEAGFLFTRLPRVNLAFNRFHLDPESTNILSAGAEALCLNQPLASEHSLFCSGGLRCNGGLSTATAFGWTSLSFVDLRCNAMSQLPANLTQTLHGGSSNCADVIVAPPLCGVDWQHHVCSSLSNGSFPGLINFDQDCFAVDYTAPCALCDDGWASSGADLSAQPCRLPRGDEVQMRNLTEQLSRLFEGTDVWTEYRKSLVDSFVTASMLVNQKQSLSTFSSFNVTVISTLPADVASEYRRLSHEINRQSVAKLSRSACNALALRVSDFLFDHDERLAALRCCEAHPTDSECRAALALAACDSSSTLCPASCSMPTIEAFGTASEIGSIAALRFASDVEVEQLARRLFRGAGFSQLLGEAAEDSEVSRFTSFVKSIIGQHETAMASSFSALSEFSSCCIENPNDWNCLVSQIAKFNIPTQGCIDCFPHAGRCSPASLSARCSGGNAGPRCLSCPEEFFRLGDECRPCGDPAYGLLALLGLLVGAVLYGLSGNNTGDLVERFVYLVNFFQVLDIAASLHVSLGPLLAAFAFLFSWLSLDIDALGLECFIGAFQTPAKVYLYLTIGSSCLVLLTISLVLLLIGDLASVGPLAPGRGDFALEEADKEATDELESASRSRRIFLRLKSRTKQRFTDRSRGNIRRPPDGKMGILSKAVMTLLNLIYLPFTRLLASLSLSACDDRTSVTFLFFGDMHCIDNKEFDMPSTWLSLTAVFALIIPLVVLAAALLARRSQSRRRAARRALVSEEKLLAMNPRQLLEFDCSVRDNADRVFSPLHESVFVPGFDALAMAYKAALVIVLVLHAEQRIRLYPIEYRFHEPTVNFLITLSFLVATTVALPFRYLPLRVAWVSSKRYILRRITLGNILNMSSSIAHTANFLLILATNDTYSESAAWPVVVLNFCVIAALVLPIGLLAQWLCGAKFDKEDDHLEEHPLYELSTSIDGAAPPLATPPKAVLQRAKSSKAGSRRRKTPRTPRRSEAAKESDPISQGVTAGSTNEEVKEDNILLLGHEDQEKDEKELELTAVINDEEIANHLFE